MKVQVQSFDEVVTASIILKGEMIATADMDLMGNKWWLSRLFVKENFRRRGLGRKLLASLKRNSRGILIEVMPGGYNMDKADQIRFYERCGFKKFDENILIWQDIR